MAKIPKTIEEVIAEELERDRTVDLETAYQLHAFAIYDAFTADDGDARRLGRERARQFARMGYDLRRPGLMVPIGKESAAAAMASLHPLAFFCFHAWPDGDHDALQDLFSTYLQAGIIKLDEPFKYKTMNGAVVSGNSVLEFALIQGKLELVTAAFRNGAQLNVVPPVFSHSGFEPQDLLAWTEFLHGAGSEIHRHLAAELMSASVQEAASAATPIPAADRVRRLGL